MEEKKDQSVNRRTFVRSAIAGIGVAATAQFPMAAESQSRSRPARRGISSRAERAYYIRLNAARVQQSLPIPQQPTNGDEARYPNYIASFSKGLPHNSLGEVDARAYEMLMMAIHDENSNAFDAVPLGGAYKLVNPQAALAFALEGSDSHQFAIPAPPPFASVELAGEAVEVYWQALMRDVPFAEYETSSRAARAAEELSRMPIFYGPKSEGRVTTRTLFRGPTPGELTGPYISQFLWKDVNQGPHLVAQKVRTLLPGFEYHITFPDWLGIQNGEPPRAPQYSTYRYIRSGRDLAAYVYTDFTYQAFLNACLILFSMRRTTDARIRYKGAPYDAGNPYRSAAAQTGFCTFGAAHVLDLVARVANDALKASWFQKWNLHRQLRPEEYGGRVHNEKKGAASYGLPREILQSDAVLEVEKQTGTSLLPQAYPEGCPLHPSYPAAHAAIAGACTTMLKAFFDESYAVEDPVVASADGLSLYPWTGERLTVGEELNKLAMNISIGRNFAGIHWRSDAVDGVLLGEAVALALLADMKSGFNEPFAGFSLTKFDGTKVVV